MGKNKKRGGGEDGPSTLLLKIRDLILVFPGVEGVTMDVARRSLTVFGKVDPAKLRDRLATNGVVMVPATKKPPDGRNNKPKEPAPGTVVLKVPLHCHGCIRRMRKVILKVEGAEQVTFHEEKDLVTVTGMMLDPKVLCEVIKKKVKREAEVVPQEKEGDDGGKKKPRRRRRRRRKKKEEGEGSGGGGGNPPKPQATPPVDPMWQMFSDENPNACSIM